MSRTKRREERRPAASPALLYDEEGRRYSGVVCDVSSRGLFVQPLARLPSNVGIGSRLRVVYLADSVAGGGGRDAMAVVRWTGSSPQHQCMGLGLELVGAPALVPHRVG